MDRQLRYDRRFFGDSERELLPELLQELLSAGVEWHYADAVRLFTRLGGCHRISADEVRGEDT